ncbi:MAG: transglycosylase domain-containing protein, partial [Synechococcus sp. BS307-5m-G39]|nr:transglycosylase domain-containing protein [Synechococcus sp. BS307-5m-G39]
MAKLTPNQPAAARLTIHQHDRPDQTLHLHGEGYRIGRDHGLEICIEHPAVSRQHALLQKRKQQWCLVDQGSTNGLWWKGRRVREIELKDGDQISLAPATEAGAPSLQFENPADRGGQRIQRWLGIALLLALGGSGALLLLAGLDVPVRGRLATVRGPVAIYDGNNKPLDSVDSSRHRELATLSDFSPLLINALLSSEDNRFWWHPGVDPIGTVRAFATNLTGGRVLEGGSSLTQQLARSLYPDLVGEGDTLGRKWRELLVALQLE